jgi:hypothetical protein
MKLFDIHATVLFEEIRPRNGPAWGRALFSAATVGGGEKAEVENKEKDGLEMGRQCARHCAFPQRPHPHLYPHRPHLRLIQLKLLTLKPVSFRSPWVGASFTCFHGIKGSVLLSSFVI